MFVAVWSIKNALTSKIKRENVLYSIYSPCFKTAMEKGGGE
jgi:hypothetical protein